MGLLNPALENAKGLVAKNPRYIGGTWSSPRPTWPSTGPPRTGRRGRPTWSRRFPSCGTGRGEPQLRPLFAQRGWSTPSWARRTGPRRPSRRRWPSRTPRGALGPGGGLPGPGTLGRGAGPVRQGGEPGPKNTDLRVRYASALLLKGKAEEAARVLEEGHRLKPLDAEGWYTLGQAYMALGRPKEAGWPWRTPWPWLPCVSLPPTTTSARPTWPWGSREGPEPPHRGGAPRAQEGGVPLPPLPGQRAAWDKEGARYQCQEALKLKPGYKEAEEVLRRL